MYTNRSALLYNSRTKGGSPLPLKPTLRVKKMTKELLVKTVSFRLSEKEYRPYGDLIRIHGYKKSKLFRDIFIDKSEKIIAPKIQSKENKRLVFLANKSANNINQIAKKLNESHRNGVINDRLYVEILNRLISVEKTFKETIKNVS